MDSLGRYGLSGLVAHLNLTKAYESEIRAPLPRRVRIANPRRSNGLFRGAAGQQDFDFCPYCHQQLKTRFGVSAGVIQCANCGRLVSCQDY